MLAVLSPQWQNLIHIRFKLLGRKKSLPGIPGQDHGSLATSHFQAVGLRKQSTVSQFQNGVGK